MGYQLGIDVGTTYTAAAVCRSPDQRWVEPEVVTLGTRNATVPSVLYMAPDGSVVVGEAAERRALTDPDRVVREFKRRVGDPTPVVVAGRAWAPEELSARLVQWVVDRVAEREGGPATRIAVTHPASWGSHKRELLATALAAHGLTVTFLAEPQAAALHYAAAERVPAGATIGVYDLGGGTFDAAVVRKGDPGAAGFGLLGRPEGLERLGGVDFDEAVFEHVRAGLPAAFEELDDTDPSVLSAVSRVRRECTEAKEALSSDTEVSIQVLLPASRGSVRLHRSEFEAMIRPRVEETVSALQAAVGSAGLVPEQLTTVLLVGGSSRIPLVGQLVSEQLGRPVAVDTDPKNAIAKGAALAVAPKPTASWPGVAIPPVGPAAEVASVAGGAAPARPPRPGLPTPPHGTDRPAAPRVVPALAARGPAGPSHEPATSLLASTGPQQARTPAPGSDRSYEPEAEPRRRPVGVLVGVGGLVAAAAVVAALLTWPDSSSPRIGTNTGERSGLTSEVVPSEAPAPAAPEGGAPAAPGPDAGAGAAGTGGGGAGGGTAGTGGGAAGTGGTNGGTGGATGGGTGGVAPSGTGGLPGVPIDPPATPGLPPAVVDPPPAGDGGAGGGDATGSGPTPPPATGDPSGGGTGTGGGTGGTDPGGGTGGDTASGTTPAPTLPTTSAQTPTV